MGEKHLWILDAGHGIDTSGKRSPLWPDGMQLMEWEFNRDIVRRVAQWGNDRFGLECFRLVPEIHDVTLDERIARANKFHDLRNCIFISIHANAADGIPEANGLEIYTTRGETDSDKVATVFMRKFDEVLPKVRKRLDFSDGDADKEKNFKVLRKTRMPAILIEVGFMTNEQECRELLMSEDGRHKITEAILAAMVEIDSNGF